MKNLETVRTEVRENSLIIYLSREERMNAFTLTMQQEIVKVLDDAEEDDDIKAIIFTGDGKLIVQEQIYHLEEIPLIIEKEEKGPMTL